MYKGYIIDKLIPETYIHWELSMPPVRPKELNRLAMLFNAYNTYLVVWMELDKTEVSTLFGEV